MLKVLRLTAMLALLCGLVRPAKAFQMIVIDPPNNPPPDTFYPVYPINTASFTIPSFDYCIGGGNVPNGAQNQYSGCYTIKNDTGSTITSLTLDVSGSAGSAATCLDAGYGGNFSDEFSQFSCVTQYDNSNNIKGYVLTFFDGSIAPDATFTIAESVDPNLFPTNIGATLGVSPEPESIWLLATGMLSGGAWLKRRRWTV